MKFCVTLTLLLGMTVCVGCGGRPASTPVNVNASQNDLKSRLEVFVQTGMVGSGAAGMKEAIQSLPADKSGPLLADYDELTKPGTSPDQVKQIAKRMVEKL